MSLTELLLPGTCSFIVELSSFRGQVILSSALHLVCSLIPEIHAYASHYPYALKKNLKVILHFPGGKKKSQTSLRCFVGWNTKGKSEIFISFIQLTGSVYGDLKQNPYLTSGCISQQEICWNKPTEPHLLVSLFIFLLQPGNHTQIPLQCKCKLSLSRMVSNWGKTVGDVLITNKVDLGIGKQEARQ